MTFAPIRLLITGGTFDKQYDEITGTLAFRETNVAEVLARGRCRRPLEVEVLMLKDSLDLRDADRARIPKPIVITGAMIPFAFGRSDGLFNLGSALSFVQVLPPNVYVAMNGRCFPLDDVRKDRELGVFEPLGG